jgi:DNA processing protein
VIGNGPDVIYPKSNAKLYGRIQENGCVISEYPLLTGPCAAHFPQRNRLISAISLGTLVIEARFKSGSLITAKLALDQNKEVFAVPGPSQQLESEGCHHLIKNGAKLVDHCADIIVELPTWLNLLDKKTIHSKRASSLQTSQALQVLSQEAQTLIMALKARGAMTYDECLVFCKLTVQTFAKAQIECELVDLISYAQGRYWLKQDFCSEP